MICHIVIKTVCCICPRRVSILNKCTEPGQIIHCSKRLPSRVLAPCIICVLNSKSYIWRVLNSARGTDENSPVPELRGSLALETAI